MDVKNIIIFIALATPWTIIVPGVFYFYRYLKIKSNKDTEAGLALGWSKDSQTMQDAIEERERFLAAIQEGLDDANAGRTISHEELCRRIEKYNNLNNR